MTTITTWKTKHEFESTMLHNSIKLDGSTENGFGPKALLLSALAGCSGIDLVDILEKMKVQFSGLTIEAEAEQTDEHPKVFKEIMVTYAIRTAEENKEKIKKAIDLSLDKYCGVAAMLKKNSPISYKIIIK
jgi:putative redox protein